MIRTRRQFLYFFILFVGFQAQTIASDKSRNIPYLEISHLRGLLFDNTGVTMGTRYMPSQKAGINLQASAWASDVKAIDDDIDAGRKNSASIAGGFYFREETLGHVQLYSAYNRRNELGGEKCWETRIDGVAYFKYVSPGASLGFAKCEFTDYYQTDAINISIFPFDNTWLRLEIESMKFGKPPSTLLAYQASIFGKGVLFFAEALFNRRDADYIAGVRYYFGQSLNLKDRIPLF